MNITEDELENLCPFRLEPTKHSITISFRYNETIIFITRPKDNQYQMFTVVYFTIQEFIQSRQPNTEFSFYEL